MLFPAKSIYPVITGMTTNLIPIWGMAQEGSWPRGEKDAWFHSATVFGMMADWEVLDKAVFGRKTLFYQNSIFFFFVLHTQFQFLAIFSSRWNFWSDPQREKGRKPKIAVSPWLKAITRKRLNPCALSSSGVGDCTCMCQRHKFLWPVTWSFPKHQAEIPHPVLFAKKNCSCRVSDSYQQGWAPVKPPVFTYSSVLDLCTFCS